MCGKSVTGLATASVMIWTTSWPNTPSVPVDRLQPLEDPELRIPCGVLHLCDPPRTKSGAIPSSPTPASHKFHRHIILGCGSVLKSDRLANDEGYGLGLGFADLLGGQCAAVAAMQHFVSLCWAQHKPTYVVFVLMLSSEIGISKHGGTDARARDISVPLGSR